MGTYGEGGVWVKVALDEGGWVDTRARKKDDTFLYVLYRFFIREVSTRVCSTHREFLPSRDPSRTFSEAFLLGHGELSRVAQAGRIAMLAWDT